MGTVGKSAVMGGIGAVQVVAGLPIKNGEGERKKNPPKFLYKF